MIKKILITVALSLTAILTPTYFVAADSYTVPMQILENGTNKTSYAAAYFAGSATVTPSDNGYAITSTITTDTSLGNYPVQMLSVDGAGVSIVADMALNKELMTLFPNVQKLPLSPNIKRSISLAGKNKKQMSPITQAFIDIAQMV